MRSAASPRSVQIGRIIYSVILCIATLLFVYRTIHWRWMWDDSIMHYGSFLMDHGMVLYRDIVDMNMPGAYFMEGWAIRVFGSGDLAARMYEFSLLAALTGSMVVIAWPYEWFAGLFAGVIFLLMHASEGPINSVERDEIMTVLIMAAYAFAFVALRRRQPVLMVPLGLLAGLATSLKPTAGPIGIVLLAMAVIELRKRREAYMAYIGYALAGFLGAFLIVTMFFVRTHSLSAFLEIMRRLLPYYAGMQQTPYREMLILLASRAMLVLLPIAVVLAFAHRDWRNWEWWALSFGVLFGAFSYFAQHKGYPYHRYSFLAFMLLWVGLEFGWAVRRSGWIRVLGVAGFSLGVLYITPLYLYRLNQVKYSTALPDTLERDLVKLGGDQLQHQVQCLDMVLGCVTALYHLHLVQTTGFLGDFLIFQSQGYPPFTFYRDKLWDELHAQPPQVLIVTNSWFAEPLSFDKLNQWPEFVKFLDDDYTLVATRDFNAESEIAGPIAYRIYAHKGSKALAAATGDAKAF